MEIEKVYDKEHAEFMNSFIAEYKMRGWGEEHEVPYNWYGQRGWIDALLHKGDVLLVCELKPRLGNVGEAIRQVKQAREAFLKACPSYASFNDIHYPLVLKATEENLGTCREYLNLIKDLEVIFWSGDKELQERINSKYGILDGGDRSADNEQMARAICLICHKPIEDNRAMCDDCLKFGWK
jgi:hypothetical protein